MAERASLTESMMEPGEERPRIGSFIPPLTSGGFHSKRHNTWQSKLKHIMHHEITHKIFIGLLILDVMFVITGIILEIEFLHSEVEDCEEMVHECLSHTSECHSSEYGQEALEEAEHILGYLSITILCLFILESFLLMIADPREFFTSFLLLLDFFVVFASLVLEVLYMDSPEGGLLVLARVWRFARIGHGFYEYEEKTLETKFSTRLKKSYDGDESKLFDVLVRFKAELGPTPSEREVVKVSNKIQKENPQVFYHLALAVGSFLEEAATEQHDEGGKEGPEGAAAVR